MNAASFPTITLCLGIPAHLGLLLTVVYLALFFQGAQGTWPKLTALLRVLLWRKPLPCHHRCLQAPASPAPGAASVFFRLLGSLRWTRTFPCGSVESLVFNPVASAAPAPTLQQWLVGCCWVFSFFFLFPSSVSHKVSKNIHQIKRVPLLKAAKRAKGDLGFTYTIWTIFTMRMFLFYLFN